MRVSATDDRLSFQEFLKFFTIFEMSMKIRPKKIYVVLPFSDRPKILQKLGRDFFFFLVFKLQFLL